MNTFTIKYTRELQGKHLAVIKQDVRLKQFLLDYDMTLIGMLRTFFGAHDPVQVRDELTEVQMKTENGVLADVGKYVTEIYTALQGIQLPDDELNLVKALLKELAKSVPHLAGRLRQIRRGTRVRLKNTRGTSSRWPRRSMRGLGILATGCLQLSRKGGPHWSSTTRYAKRCSKELKLRLKSDSDSEGKNRSEFHGKHKFRHSEEQPMVQGKDQPIEGKESLRLIPSCTNCGKTGGHRPLRQQLLEKRGWSLPRGSAGSRYEKAEVAAQPNQPEGSDSSDHSLQSNINKLCTLLEPLVNLKSQLEAAQHD